MKTGARLHLGFYSFVDHGIGRAYGGLGLAIERPRMVVEIERSGEVSIEAPEEHRDVVEEVVRAFGAPLRVKLRECIPRHVGLGSTTQLVLALATGIARILDVDVDEWSVAAAFARGPVSGVGVATFLMGGLVVDSGTSIEALRRYPALSPEDVPRPIAWVPLPEEWRFIIVVPPGKGLDESKELNLLSEPREVPREVAYELLRQVFLKLLPAARRGDARAFGEAVSRIQRIVGEYFSQSQGGVFAAPHGDAVAEALEVCGSLCVGQSSWGPAMYGLAPSPEKGEEVANCVLRNLLRRGIDATVFTTPPRNVGRVVEVVKR